MRAHDEQDERQLVEAAQADPARFVELYDRYFPRVYAYVVRRTGSRGDAEDVTSEVFERALAGLRGFEWHGAPFGAWLMRIAANAVADGWQRAGRMVDAAPDDAGGDDDLERRVLLYQLVERLPAAQRQVVELRFGEDRSLSDVARRLGRSEGAVKQLQRRALEALRAALGGGR